MEFHAHRDSALKRRQGWVPAFAGTTSGVVANGRRSASLGARARQRGVVAIEFALMMIFGLIPLLYLTFAGVMIFVAKESLTLAASEGARYAVRFQDVPQDRLVLACDFAAARLAQTLTRNVEVTVTPSACGDTQCATVVTEAEPAATFGWGLDRKLKSSATAQIEVAAGTGLASVACEPQLTAGEGRGPAATQTIAGT